MLFAKPYPIATYTFSPTFKTWRIFWSCEKTNIEYFCGVKTLRDYHLLLVEFFAVVWQFGRCILLHLVMIQSKDSNPISQNLSVIFPLDFLLSGLFTMALPYQSCGNGEECWSFGMSCFVSTILMFICTIYGPRKQVDNKKHEIKDSMAKMRDPYWWHDWKNIVWTQMSALKLLSRQSCMFCVPARTAVIGSNSISLKWRLTWCGTQSGPRIEGKVCQAHSQANGLADVQGCT